jgi:acid phosphatase family membrane protein YuiD
MRADLLTSVLHSLADLFDNGPLWWGLVACGLAQLSKLVIELVVHRRWNPRVLVETGGMPSSHSALITGTTAGLGWTLGLADPLFGFAAILCFIVLYDASGVRRNAGLIASRVNELPPDLWPARSEHPLKESLGHTRLEVLIGSLMGPAIALPGLVLVGSPLQLAVTLGLMTPIG